MTVRQNTRSSLFCFDNDTLGSDVLLQAGHSCLEYREYAVFKVADPLRPDAKLGSRPAPRHVHHSITSEVSSGNRLFDLALRHGHGLDVSGKFVAHSGPDPALEGRVRQIICRRRVKPTDGQPRDGLTMTTADFDALGLHPATLQYTRRITSETMFWDQHHDNLSLVLAFSANPVAPFDFLSMTYSIPDRCCNVLIRQSFDPRRHNKDELDEYEQRIRSCQHHWAHPFVLPVTLLQVQFMRTEETVAECTGDIKAMEWDVANMAGFAPHERKARPRPPSLNQTKTYQIGGSITIDEQTDDENVVPQNTTQLMKLAHDCLKRTIKLDDTIKWMTRSIGLLIQSGDELERRMQGAILPITPLSPLNFHPSLVQSPTTDSFQQETTGRMVLDPMSSHWHEIRQYLDSLNRLCMSLETDRAMLQQRCESQIDIVYAKMAQEDNMLNARMAVSSTRDSSSMKALAVITAIFLPGEFIGTLFGISMFDFEDATQQDDKDGDSGGGGKKGGQHLVSNYFWMYWAIVVPLTLVIFCMWRCWWVGQDRYFRKHLSRELSEERYWTDNGKPRPLDHSFLYDFFYLSARRDEKASLERVPSFSRAPSVGRTVTAYGQASPSSPGRPPNMRLRQIGLARLDGQRKTHSPV